MLQNEVLKNERFIGALSRSAQNTVVPPLSTPAIPSHFFHNADSEIYSRSERGGKKNGNTLYRVTGQGIIPLMNTVLGNT